MFSLFISLIAVVIVSALAFAVIYYGGSVWVDSQSEARAATLVTQSQQILGALNAFYVQQGRWPDTADELVTYKYLVTIPRMPPKLSNPDKLQVAASFFISEAYADDLGTGWAQVSPGSSQFWIQNTISSKICKNINLQVRQDNGIHIRAMHKHPIQCYGSAENYTLVVNAEVILDAADDGGGWAEEPTILPSGSTDPSLNLQSHVTFFDTTAGTALSTLTVPSSPVGAKGSTTSVRLTNDGTGTLTFAGNPFTVDAPFFVGSTTCVGALAPNASCFASFGIQPPLNSEYTGTLTVNSDSIDTSMLNLSGSAGVDQPSISSIAPNPVHTPGGESVTVTGTGFLQNSVVYIDGSAVPTTYVSANTLAATTPAKAIGNYPLAVTVPGFAQVASSTPLTYVKGGPEITFENTSGTAVISMDFPSTAVGQTSAVLTYEVVNTGTSTLTFGSTPISVAAPFTLASTTCSNTLAASTKCDIGLTFSPTQETAYSGNYLTVASDATMKYALALTGTGTTKVLQGTVTKMASVGTRFAIGPDSTTVYFVDTQSNTLKKRSADGTITVQPVNIPDTCSTSSGAVGNEVRFLQDITYDKMSGYFFLSAFCDRAPLPYTYHIIQMLRMDPSSFTGSALLSQPKASSSPMGQVPALMTSNHMGIVMMTTWQGALSVRSSNLVQGPGYGGMNGESGTTFKDRMAAYANPYPISIYTSQDSGSSNCVTDLACTYRPVPGGSVKAMDMALNGDLVVVSSGGYGLVPVGVTWDKSGAPIFTPKATVASYTAVSSPSAADKLVVAPDGSVYIGDASFLIHVQ